MPPHFWRRTTGRARGPYADHVHGGLNKVSGALAGWWRRWAGSNLHDAIRMLALAAVLVVGAYGEAHPNQVFDKANNGHPVPHTPTAALLLVAVAGGVLAARRWHPAPVLIVSTGCIVAYSLLGYVNGSVLVAAPFALYTVVTRVPPVRALAIAAATATVLMAATAAGNPFGPTGGGFYLIPAMIALALFIGTAVASQRARAVAAWEAARDKTEEDARRRVDEERLRIARELHDIVAHTMATINVQAGVAAHVLAENPAAAGTALRAIRQSSKEGLQELRAILGVLRQADDGDPTQPAPGLDHVEALVASAGGAGLPVTLHRSGVPARLPPAVDLAAYRIIQESLTNVIKHAGPAAQAAVSISCTGSRLRVEVTDTGVGRVPGLPGGGGHGLIGMRERAASVDGTLSAGPGPSGGYRVVAVLPAELVAPAGAEHATPARAGPASTAPACAAPASTVPETTGPATSSGSLA
jgi:signal transduction histidine kinase